MKVVAFDTEILGHNVESGVAEGRVVLVAIVDNDGTEIVLREPDMRRVWDEYLKDADVLVGANIKFDLAYARQAGVPLEEIVYKEGKVRQVWDVLTVYEMVFSGLFETFSLEAVARRMLGVHLDKSTRALFSPENLFFGQFIITPEMEQYCLEDAKTTLHVFEKQRALIQGTYLEILWDKIEMPALWATFIAQDRGVHVDTETWAKMVDELSTQLREELKAFTLAFKVDPLSPKQVVTWLQKHGRGVQNASEETLQSLAKAERSAEVRDFCTHVLKIRDLSKKVGTYGTNILTKHIRRPSNRIHPQFRSIGAVTGRMASQNPSLQNIPRDPAIRSLFIASPGHKLIIGDYSAQEPRIGAQLSKDPKFIAAVNAKDIYIQIGRELLGWDITDKHDPRRQIVKVLLLALMYGAGPRTIAKQANISTEEAQLLTDTLLREIYRFREYAEYARQAPIVFTLTGFPVWVVTSMERLTALNAPIQGSGSNMIKGLCRRLLERWYAEFQSVPPFAIFVHDEIVLEVPEKEADMAKRLLDECALATAAWLHPDVSAKFDSTIGNTWADKE